MYCKFTVAMGTLPYLRSREWCKAVRTKIHCMPEEFENGGFNPKLHEIGFIHTTPEKFKNATITDHFGFLVQ